MMEMWKKYLVFAVLLFHRPTHGSFEKQKVDSFVGLQRKSRGETSPSIRGLKHGDSKGMSKRMQKKGKSKKAVNIHTLSPTATQFPAPSTGAPLPSILFSSIPVSTTPTTMPFETFTPTVGASVAPTYVISIGPSPVPSKGSVGSIRPTSVANQPTSKPSESKPTPIPPTTAPARPSGRPITPPSQSPLPPTNSTQTPPPAMSTPKPAAPAQSPPPPTPIQIATQLPQSISPTVAGPHVVDLSPFTLNYTLSRPRIPFRTEYVELANVTGAYLENFFLAFYRNATGIHFEALVAIYKSASVFFGSPIQVEFSAVASFSSNTTPVPTVTQLNNLLATALGKHVDGYVNFIQHQLALTNTFATTENATLVPTTTMKIFTTKISESTSGGGARNSTSTGSSLSTVAISIGAVAAVALLMAMAVTYRRHRKFDPTTQIDKRPPSYTSVTGGTSDIGTLEESSSLKGRQRFPGIPESSDEQSVDSSNWGEFVQQPKSSKKSPRQIMSEMDLISAMGDTSQVS